MENSGAIAIVIVSWESAGYLTKAVASAHASLRRNDEIIVWDNASSAATLAELDAIAAQWPAVRIERCKENLGFAAGNNRAIALAGATHDILCLNPDAELRTDTLLEMRSVLATDARIGAVGAVQLTTDTQTIDGLGDRLSISGRPQRIAIGEPAGSVAARIGPSRVESVFSPCAAVALYRRDALTETGGFDEDFFCYCEDVDLGFRLRLNGFECVRANKAVALHAGSASSGRHSDFASFYGHRNLVWVFVKNMPTALLALLFLPHLALNLASIVYFTVKGRPGVIFRAKASALRGLPLVFRKRRAVQQRRRATVKAIFKALG